MGRLLLIAPPLWAPLLSPTAAQRVLPRSQARAGLSTWTLVPLPSLSTIRGHRVTWRNVSLRTLWPQPRESYFSPRSAHTADPAPSGAAPSFGLSNTIPEACHRLHYR